MEQRISRLVGDWFAARVRGDAAALRQATLDLREALLNGGSEVVEVDYWHRTWCWRKAGLGVTLLGDKETDLPLVTSRRNTRELDRMIAASARCYDLNGDPAGTPQERGEADAEWRAAFAAWAAVKDL